MMTNLKMFCALSAMTALCMALVSCASGEPPKPQDLAAAWCSVEAGTRDASNEVYAKNLSARLANEYAAAFKREGVSEILGDIPMGVDNFDGLTVFIRIAGSDKKLKAYERCLNPVGTAESLDETSGAIQIKKPLLWKGIRFRVAVKPGGEVIACVGTESVADDKLSPADVAAAVDDAARKSVDAVHDANDKCEALKKKLGEM